MPTQAILILIFICYVAPFGVEARTGKVSRQSYITSLNLSSANWKSAFLQNYIAIRFFTSTIQALGIILFGNLKVGSVDLGVILISIGLLLGVLVISWPLWIKIGE